MASSLDKLIERIEEINDKLTKFSDDLESGKIENEIFKEVSKQVKKDYDNIYHSCVDVYYESYEPDYYKPRKHSLYNMYDVIVTDDDVEYFEDPNLSNLPHRVNNEYLFDKMWMEGWHGGATYSEKLDYFKRPYPNGFEMAYRKPVTYQKRFKKNKKQGKGIPKYSLWSYREVAKSEPIQEMVDKEIELYQSGESNRSGSTQKERTSEGINNVVSEYSIY